MKTFVALGVFLFLLSIYIKTSNGVATKVIRSKRSLGNNSSVEGFNMFIKEKGSHFNEKLKIDLDKKTMTHHVPAHGDLPESHVLIDFNSNVAVVRQHAQRSDGEDACFVRSRSPSEPSFDEIRSGMERVSTGKYKIEEGETLISSEWSLKGPADPSKLSKHVLEFCRGLPIYRLEEVEEDGVSVGKERIRKKRQSGKRKPLPLCKDFFTGYDFLDDCPIKSENHQQSCKFVDPMKTCVHWITCSDGLITTARNGGTHCTSTHRYDKAICCDLSCPLS